MADDEIIFVLTKHDVICCAMEMGISPETITNELLYQVKKRIDLGVECWSEVVKEAIRDAILTLQLTGDVYESEVAKWIEPGVIAETLFGIDGVETLEQAKEVWLNFMRNELADGLKRSANAILRCSERDKEAE